MAKDRKIIEKLKKRWGVKSAAKVIIILIVFSCTGFSILYVNKLVYDVLNIPDGLGTWMKVLFVLIITLPIYNILLLIYGFIFGQFKFFWNFEKRFFGRIFGRFWKSN